MPIKLPGRPVDYLCLNTGGGPAGGICYAIRRKSALPAHESAPGWNYREKAIFNDSHPNWAPDSSRVMRLIEPAPGVLQVRPSVASDGRTIAFNRDYRNGEEDEVTLIHVARLDRPIPSLWNH